MAWKPKEGDTYYTIAEGMLVTSLSWEGDKFDNRLYEMGACFRTKSAANKVAKQFKKILKEADKG